MVVAEQKDILNLIKAGQLDKALVAIGDLSPVIGEWKHVLEIRVLRMLKRGADALTLAEELYQNQPATKQELSSELLRYIALAFNENGRADEALKIYQKICSEDSQTSLDPLLLLEYGISLSGQGLLDEAEFQLRRGCKLLPTNADFHSQLGRIYCRSGRVDRGIESYQRAAFLEPTKTQYLQRIAYWSNYSDRFSQQTNFQLARLWANNAYPKNQTGSNTWRDANPDKPLKIGFVSGDFCAHAVSFFITPLLKNIDRKQFQVIAYSDVTEPDYVTKEIQKHCDQWRDAARLNDDLLAAQMGADQLDILIDLSGHSANNRLGIFSQHIAPIQISWLGYPATTGLDSIQYRITDKIADPVSENKDYFSEKLIRLNTSFLCYEPYADSPKITTTSAQSKTAIRFGSFNNLAKISATTLDAWAGVLLAVPNSTLYIKRQQLINKNAKQFLIAELNDRGINESRLILKTSKAKIKDHLAEYNEIDIALDTSPYNGTTTTLESLWMGTPVITLKGKTHASRVSSSILHYSGLTELIADSTEEYIQIAQQLADNRKQLARLSNSLRAKLAQSSLLDHSLFATEFTNNIRDKWQLWCYTRNTEQGVDIKEKIMGSQKNIMRADA